MEEEEEEKEKMEEEEEGKEKMEEEEEGKEKKSEKSTMELLFDYVKKDEKKGEESQFRFLVKQRNLLNYPPERNEKLRAGLERVTLNNLLLTIKGKIETLVVKSNAVYTVNVKYNGKEETFELSLPDFVDEFLKKVDDYEPDALMSVLLVEQSECFLKILIERLCVSTFTKQSKIALKISLFSSSGQTVVKKKSKRCSQTF
jgi:hypothetical protein